MAFLDFLRRNKQLDIVHDEGDDQYRSEQIGTFTIPDKLTNKNAFGLANTLTEIYFPIDFYADRISKLRYYIAKNGKEVEKSDLNRFITNPNPFYSLADLIYQYVFSYMADGAGVTYQTVPSSYTGVTNVSNLDRVDVLQPDLLEILEFGRLSILKAKSHTDIIRSARYWDNVGFNEALDLSRLRIDNIDSTRREGSNVLSRSPLFKAIRPINNLLATYSARYNVYANNGAAGMMVKKESSKGGDLQQVIDPVTRDQMLADINNRYGLSGHRFLKGLSSIPMEFINMLVDIQKLMPFEETLEDSIKIASVYQIPPELVPRKDQSTFSNKGESERAVWENGLMSMAETVCQNWTKILTLDKAGFELKVDYSTVSCLKSNETDRETLNAQKLANLAAIKAAYPEKEAQVNLEIDKILLSYGQQG